VRARVGVLDGGRSKGETLGVQRALQDRRAARYACLRDAQLADDDADVAQAGQHPVQLRLVGDLDDDRGRAVVIAGHTVPAEPVGPVVVEVALDADG
jgi:hypothetical protein